MKQSLKQKLHELLKNRNGQVVYLQEIEDLCHELHYKLSNAERRLRASESPNIEAVRNTKGAIIGYKWRGGVVSELQQILEDHRAKQPNFTQTRLI